MIPLNYRPWLLSSTPWITLYKPLTCTFSCLLKIRLELGFEVLHLPDNPGHRLMTYTAADGSAARHSLSLLSSSLGASRT